MYRTVNGLVLRETLYKESSKILTVLTDTFGKLTVSARGAKRKGSKISAVSQLFAFSELTLCLSRERWYLNEGVSLELFRGLRKDIKKLALGEYFLELLEAVSDEDSSNPALLRLGLNSLYALSETAYEPVLIKAALELKLMCLSGYEPSLASCASCGNTDIAEPRLDPFGGIVFCSRCRAPVNADFLDICHASLAAMRYITSAENRKLFSFSLNGKAQMKLAAACESYVRTHLERSFYTLEFYRKLLGE